MAKYGSDKVAFLLVDGYSVLGYTTQFSDDKEALLEETHVLGDAWVAHTPVGVRKAQFSQDGFFDDAAGASNVALVGNTGVARVLCYGVAGNTIGRGMVGFSGAMQVNYQRIAARNALHRANAKYLGSGVVEEGVILHTLTAETAAGNTEASSHDNAASSAAGGSGYLQLSALTLGGYTNISIKVRHSADNVTFADLITFTAVTAAPAAQRSTVAGTVNRYLASSWAYTGAGAGQSATFMVGFSRG